jgi:hypothetical protein
MVTLMLGSMLVWLTGCAIATPWPRLMPPSAEQGNEDVVLVLTRVVLDASRRQEFDRQNSAVLASMGTHPGLLGYAARKQVFGGQGWTMSVWANDESRAAFVRSAVHRDAIARSLPALRGPAPPDLKAAGASFRQAEPAGPETLDAATWRGFGDPVLDA